MRIDTIIRLLTPVINKRVPHDFLSRMDRNIKTAAGVDVPIPGTKGYIQVFIFRVTDVYEMLAAIAVAVFLALILIIITAAAGSLAAGVLMAISIASLTLSRYTASLKAFKDRFQRDLPNTIDAMLQGLKTGTPVETVMEYVAGTRKDSVAPFLKEVVARIQAGESLETAFNNVVPKTLSHDFERVTRILSLRSQTTMDMTNSLQSLQENMEMEMENKIISAAENAPVRFTLHMLVGYFIPFIILITYPLFTMILQIMNIAG